MIEIDQIRLFRSLFNGREDAFAIRWEKANKSGYMPSYQFDPYHYRIHKAKGGTLANYQDKTLQPLTDEQIKRHILGEQLIGIYPLLPQTGASLPAPGLAMAGLVPENEERTERNFEKEVRHACVYEQFPRDHLKRRFHIIYGFLFSDQAFDGLLSSPGETFNLCVS